MTRSEKHHTGTGKVILFLVVFLSISGLPASAQSFDWPQWGGPSRNFKSDVKGLAAFWPETGPRRL
jgi:hypothetical protein